jgi:uncharacterized tellurite resistance protein B-like protein
MALLGAAGVVGVILWRLHMAAEAAKGLAETANEARGLFRRWGWQRKFAKDPLDLVSDPREGAAAMMVAVAQHDGAMTERERAAILRQIVERFETSGRQAEDLLAHGRWLTRDVRDADRCLSRLTPFMQRACSAQQCQDLVEMLRAVSQADGAADTLVTDAIGKLERAIVQRRIGR